MGISTTNLPQTGAVSEFTGFLNCHPSTVAPRKINMEHNHERLEEYFPF